MIRKLPPQAETAIQQELMEKLEWMKKPELYCFAIPNQGQRRYSTASRMRAEGMRAGVADIFFFLGAGRVGFVEMKTTTGSLSDEQKGFRAICERNGVLWAMARSVLEALLILQSWGFLRAGIIIEQ